MKRISTNIAFLVALSGIVSFSLVYRILGYTLMVELASSLVLGASFVVAMTWARTAYEAVRHGARDGAGLLSLGIFVLATAVFINRSYASAFRWLDRPEWLLLSPLNPLGPWSIFWGLAIILLAPGTVKAQVPARNFLYIVGAVFLGSLVAGITFGLFLANATAAP